MKGMILAAGIGTRLWPLTKDRAKPAVPFLNRPLIAYCIEYLYRFGVRDLIINLHHRSDSIRHALAGRLPDDLRIHFSEEPEILGTGGALDRVRDQLSEGTFIVINGKILTEIDLDGALRTHREKEALATLVLRHNRNYERFSIVESDGNDQITHFAGFPAIPQGERPAALNSGPLMFTGVQFLEPAIFDYIPQGQFSHTTTSAYPKAIQEGRMIAAHVSDAPWFELSTLERYLSASLHFLDRAGSKGVFGVNCQIHPTARVEQSVLWDNVRVGAGAVISGCIVGDGCDIPAGSRFERVAIVTAPAEEEHRRGQIVGKHLVVEIH